MLSSIGSVRAGSAFTKGQACHKTRSLVLPHLLRLRRHPRGEAVSVRATLYSTLLRLSIVGLGIVER